MGSQSSVRSAALAWVERVVLTACIVFGLGARAQSFVPPPGFDLERLSLNPSAGASLIASTGDVLERGQLRVSVLGHYQHEPLVLRRDTGERIGAAVSQRVDSRLLAAWSPIERLELSAHLPVIWAQRGDDLTGVGIADPSGVSLGTGWLGVRYGLLEQRAGAPIDLAAQLGVGIPLGSSRAFASDEAFAAQPRVGLGRRVGPIRLGGEVGLELSPRRGDATSALGNAVTTALAFTTLGKGLRGEVVARGAYFFGGAGAPFAGDVLAGGRVPLGRLELFALGGPGMGNAPGNPAFRVLAGVAWGTRPPAPPPALRVEAPLAGSDEERLQDDVDACAGEPGPGCPVAVAEVTPPAEPQKVRIVESGLWVEEKLHFATGKADVLPTSFDVLDRVAKVLIDNPQVGVLTVEGHTDSVGNPARNKRLSLRRAEAIRAELIERGVSGERLVTKGHGAEQPIADNRTPEGREQNRRVEFRFQVQAPQRPQ